MATAAQHTRIVKLGEPASVGQPQTSLGDSGVPDWSVVSSFTGLTYSSTFPIQGFHTVPPDVTIAVGATTVVEMVNDVVGIWTKQGTLLQQTYLNAFFKIPPTDDLTDPKVIYDQSSGHFFASIADITTTRVYVAYSASGDPTGTWGVTYFTSASNYCPDQPKLGVNDDKVVVSWDDYSSCTTSSSTWIGGEYRGLNKADFLSGGSFYYCYHNPDASFFGLYPVQSLSSSPGEYLVSVNDTGASSAALRYLMGAPTATTGCTFTLSSAPIGPTHYPPNAPQQGSTFLVDTGDSRILDGFYYQGSLWFTFNDRCTPTGDSTNRSCFRIDQVSAATGATKQDFDVGVSGEYLFYPAIRINSQANVLVIFGYSSSTDYPSLGITTQPSGTPANNYLTPSTLLKGTGPEAPGSFGCTTTSCRYGDYFGASTDPSSTSSIWVGGETGTTNGWSSYIANVNPGSTQGIAPLNFSYAVQGGGTGYSPPTLVRTLGGVQYSITLTTTVTAYYADVGSSWTVDSTLTGSNAGERWMTTQTVAGTVSASVTQTFVYYHQYLVTPAYSIVGSGSPAPPTFSYTSFGSSVSLQLAKSAQSIWPDAGTKYVATNPLAGSGPTERWYSAANNGTVSASAGLSISYHHQYLLTVVGATTASTWLDEGAQYTLSLPATFNRANGAGLRIASVTLDAGSAQKQPLTTGNVTIPVTMNAAHTLTLGLVNQYQVSLDAATAKAVNSITAPTISGDNYWYDSGSPVSLVLNGVFGRPSGTGSRLASYSVNGGSSLSVSTTGTVNVLSLSSISSPQSVTSKSVTQYQLSTPTGSVASTTAPTITGDAGWYDSATAVTIAYNYVWNVVPQQSRLAATGYSVDSGAITTVSKGGAGTFNVAATMDSAHTVDVKSVTQYYVSFQFSDAAGKRTITPSALSIAVGTQTQPVPGFTTWLDSGTTFTIATVTYEGVDVKPSGAQQYSVSAPAAIALKTSVYDATVKVTDFLGLAVSGADVKMTLANGTTISGSTGGDGTFVAPAIPLGTFTATVSGIGSSSQVTGDASKQSVTTTSVLFSATSLSIVVVIVLVVVGLAVFMFRRRSGRGAGKTTMAAQPPTGPTRISCPSCGSPVEESEPFCPNCGAKIR